MKGVAEKHFGGQPGNGDSLLFKYLDALPERRADIHHSGSSLRD